MGLTAWAGAGDAIALEATTGTLNVNGNRRNFRFDGTMRQADLQLLSGQPFRVDLSNSSGAKPQCTGMASRGPPGRMARPVYRNPR